MKRILLIMMLLLIPQSLSDPDPAYDGLYTVAGVPWVGDLGKEDVIIEHWYPIEDWEIEVCSKWGGTAEASSNAAGGAVATGSTNLALTTLTLQGQKTYIADDETYIYEAAWYLMPLGDTQKYKVQFIGDSGVIMVYEGSAGPTGDANYYAEETDEEYDKVKLIYETGTLTVPMVEK